MRPVVVTNLNFSVFFKNYEDIVFGFLSFGEENWLLDAIKLFCESLIFDWQPCLQCLRPCFLTILKLPLLLRGASVTASK